MKKNYTVLNDEGINYMVKGLNENLDKFIPAEKNTYVDSNCYYAI